MIGRLFVLNAVIAVVAVTFLQTARAAAPTLAGVWTLNTELSDRTPDSGPADGEAGRQGGRGGGGGGRRGGFGGGGFGGPGVGRGIDREEVERMRNALRDELQAPARITIVESGTTVIITADDGRTTRLSTDGTKIKDETTKVERRTRWQGDRLVTEVTGLGRGKITETYALEPEQRQLRITIQIDGESNARTFNRVYDAAPVAAQ